MRLLRARWINFISMIGVMLGVAAIIVVMSVMDGFQIDLRQMIRGTLADVLVPISPKQVDSYRDLKIELEKLAGVGHVTLQNHTFGAIPLKTRGIDGGLQNIVPLRMVGILPRQEAKVSRLLDQLEPAPGHPEREPFGINAELIPTGFLPSETPRIVVSEWLAHKLGVVVGSEFGILHFEQEGTGADKRFRTHDRDVVVSRIYKSGNSEYDQLHVYVDLSNTGSVFFPNPESSISELRIKLTDYSKADRMRREIARTLGQFDARFLDPDAHEIYIQTWEDRQVNLLRAVNNEKFLLAFVLFFIVVVACFTIFATLTMTVVEKTRDIGVLRALGATPGGILGIFVLNGTLVGTIGAALGYGVGLLVAHNVNPIRVFLREAFGVEIFPPHIYLFDDIPTHIDHRAALQFAVGAAVCALIFAIIPAIRASRLQPVKALRFE
ncbi:MAG: FtsX-like permease family protein [Planctomycetota bacterium]|nr:FtsX-like permease family protein [Planctomycetota bacterium]